MSAGYLETMGIPLLRGRAWTRQEALNAPTRALVNEAAAEHFWPGQNPIGRRIAVEAQPGAPWYEVAGIVKATRDEGLDIPPQPALYIPMEARFYPPSVIAGADRRGPAGFSESLRRAVERVDKDQAVYVVAPMQSLLDNSVAGRRFGVMTLSIFGVLALVLAAAGMPGVVSYSVAQRTAEIGVRMALGAQAGDVLRMVLRQGLGLTAVGVALGLAGAFVLTRSLAGLLFEVSATDPAIFAGVPLLLTAVELLACYLPARRAAAVDPVTSLRGSN